MLQTKLNISRKMTVSVPGDKSISHRTVLFCALSEGTSEIHGFLEGEDPKHTLSAFAALGLQYEQKAPGSYRIQSPGKKNLRSPKSELDFGNAGTGIRLSAGLLSGLPGIQAVLTGDASLQKRPMARIIDPIRAMGGQIRSVHGNGQAPLEVKGSQLQAYTYKSPIASAQIKSALVFASLASDISLEYEEPELSRDHTENMISFLGGKIEYRSPLRFRIEGPYKFSSAAYQVPRDLSSASFFLVLALCAKGEPTLIPNVGLNPSRIGVLTVLKRMNGKIEIQNQRKECGEIVGDLLVYPSHLQKIEIEEALIPSIIDEIPILTIAGLFSEGGFSIRHAKELRAKESDRIHAMVKNLQTLGITVEEYEDGYAFGEVSQIKTGSIDTFMDHRIAMSFSILAKLADVNLSIDDVSWVDTSFPGFFQILKEF
ncbi:3-phosphoshikimate 1-carboxyvinyltransferase [Leptospira ryugenii]|uniref:3-phosphoshikimate 1-carboxyvinyltransferase n=1 Tax=Leptospira ryugenii TaxID=1917863 RepID=A0A2P2E1F5_9LEPT|nr:3-phosphoshikimate 1-carboxyvinyltransferase [Leptospira ryugenii]GBF50710.1 3-phosphoshikimate 1-carboxyvinyltransferase [Leptospira ryugenii]